MKKIVSLDKALESCRSGMSVMIGGYHNCGVPVDLVEALTKRNKRDLTLISNDIGSPDQAIGKLAATGLLSKAIVSYIGEHPQVYNQIDAGTLTVEFVPQGTLAERIRSGGCGLGGVLTQTGLGTLVEDGKQTLTIDSKKFLVELPLRADVALIKAWKADVHGNLIFKGPERNFNPLMAMAADTVIVQADHIVPLGEIDSDAVVSPGVLVDMIVQTGA